MDELEKILQLYEFDVIDANNRIFDKLLNEFMHVTGEYFTFVDKDSTNKVLALKDQYIYTSKYCELFFKILEKYEYNMMQEIKDAFFDLHRLENPDNNSEMIKKYLNSPVIQDISFKPNSGFTITSEQYGEFTSQIASYVFKKNRKMSRYISKDELAHKCHIHAYFMSFFLKDFYAVTSLCESYFHGSYYHSFTCDNEENRVIDLCSNMVMDKDMFYKLFKSQEVSVILNSNVKEELEQVKSKLEWYYGRLPLLKIALYKQYLERIGYSGELKDGPFLVKF